MPPPACFGGPGRLLSLLLSRETAGGEATENDRPLPSGVVAVMAGGSSFPYLLQAL